MEIDYEFIIIKKKFLARSTNWQIKLSPINIRIDLDVRIMDFYCIESVINFIQTCLWTAYRICSGIHINIKTQTKLDQFKLNTKTTKNESIRKYFELLLPKFRYKGFLSLKIVLAACIAAVIAISDDGIVRRESVITADGFETHLELSDQKQDASGHLNGDSFSHQGSYSWVDPNGELVTISYTADETGYHPTGTGVHPIPEAIVKSLAYLETHAPKEH